MCNAYGHPPGCTCGWGGEGHLGKGGNWSGHGAKNHFASQDYTISRSYNWELSDDEDFCKPSTCPICGASVFFVRHNGGSVWLDSLGKPWPTHACFDEQYFPVVRQKFYEIEAEIFGIATNVEVIELFEKGKITVKCSNEDKITGIFTYNGDIKNWLGQIVSIQIEKNSITLESVSLTKIKGQCTDYFKPLK